MKPIDPSPTPWNHSTWGFYCDHCEKFFPLNWDGKVLVDDSSCLSYTHNICGQRARYIGYDHSPKWPGIKMPKLTPDLEDLA